MNATNTQKPLEVRIDGELVTPTMSEQATAIGNTVLGCVQAAGSVLLHNLGNVASEATKAVITPVLLDVHDSMHGSHLRDEYFARKHELATAAMRDEVGL